jgi:hypothetical protein
MPEAAAYRDARVGFRHGRARMGHPRGAVSGSQEAVARLDDVDDRDEPGHDDFAVATPAPIGGS